MTVLQEDTLTPEERLLWACARAWRQPASVPPSKDIKWELVLNIGKNNRMQALLKEFLTVSDMWPSLPKQFMSDLDAECATLSDRADVFSNALATYLRLSADRGVETVVLKGLWLSIEIYGHPAARPGGDIDILVRRNHVEDSLEILKEMGYGRYWPNLLDDRYYDRHHLHQQRCTEDWKTWFETHWALEHPYTLLTIDYEGIMDRTVPGNLLGERLNNLSLPDQLLLLTTHLVKHAIYLPEAINHPDLQRLIIADGMLVYFVDIAEVIKKHGEKIDWECTIQRAFAWGVSSMVGAVLHVCRSYLDCPIPDWVVDKLPVEPRGRLVQFVMNQMITYELATYLNTTRNRWWDFLIITNGAFILRPIRVLDTIAYLFPPAEFLTRRYRATSRIRAVKHSLIAFGKLFRLSLDTIYYTAERYLRLRAQNFSTSLFNHLETEN